MSKKKTYVLKIQEHVSYQQEGTVFVDAKSEEEARKLAMKGKYVNSGDNTIDYNTEGPCIEREIISCEIHEE